uniref:Uncharacterized protein n=2 Tax=Dunaliella tertiolecta TaxID=3047 RepID=A0A6S8JB84_DUNTE
MDAVEQKHQFDAQLLRANVNAAEFKAMFDKGEVDAVEQKLQLHAELNKARERVAELQAQVDKGGQGAGLQQQQQQQQYRGKRSRDEERTGGAAREEGLAHVMRALCRDDCAAGDVMVGVCAAIPNGSIGVRGRGGSNPDASGCSSSRSSSSSSSAFECLERGPTSNGSRQRGPQAGGRLRSLCLSHTSIGDGCLSALQGLTSLDITGCKRVSDTGVLQVLMRCRQLQVLKLGSIPALTPSALGGPVSPAAAVQPTAAVGLPTAAAVHQPVTAAAAAAAAANTAAAPGNTATS